MLHRTVVWALTMKLLWNSEMGSQDNIGSGNHGYGANIDPDVYQHLALLSLTVTNSVFLSYCHEQFVQSQLIYIYIYDISR